MTRPSRPSGRPAPAGAARDSRTAGPARTIAAACVGNALEWYDIAVYSYFAVYLSKAFFTGETPATALLYTLGTFAVSFLVRPLGAVVLGSYADRRGRRPALTLSLNLMVLGTLLICVMPTYEDIGPAASAGILLARLLQGFAAGGEFGSATAMMVEHLPHRRGFAASWQFTSQAMSSLLAALLGTGLTTWMDSDDLYAWGFRLPFVVGLLVGPVGLYIRRRVPEPEEARAVVESAEPHSPVRTVLARQKLAVLLTVGLMAVTTCLNYLITYIPTYAIKTLHLPGSTGFAATIVAALALLAITPFSGHLADRIGGHRIMLPAVLAVLALIYPLFALTVAYPVTWVLLATLLVIGLLKGAYYGPLPGVMTSLFPTRTRATGMAVGYNIGVTVFGGFTPFVAAWLTGVTGSGLAPSFWVILAAVLSTASILVVRRRARRGGRGGGAARDTGVEASADAGGGAEAGAGTGTGAGQPSQPGRTSPDS